MPYTPLLHPFGRPLPRLGAVDWRGGVLVRSTNWLGDALMTLPAVWRLRRQLPSGVPLAVLSPSSLAPLWRAARWVDEVVWFDGRHADVAARQVARGRGFGVGVVLPNSFATAWEMWRLGVPVRVGRAGRFRSWLLTHRLPEWRRGEGRGAWHQLSYYLELASVFGDFEWSAAAPPLEVDPVPAQAHGIARGRGWLALAPGANFGPAKQWPLKNYREVAMEWLGRGGQVVLVGTAKDRAVCGELAEQVGAGALNLAGRTTLTELMSVLAGVDGVVANDSGAMHLAAALGTPGIGLFASTDPAATGPLGAPWELLVADVPCRPCLKRECPRKDAGRYQCMAALPPKRVAALLDTLGRK